MILLSLSCVLISALAIIIAGLWQRYGTVPAGFDQEKALYGQFVADIDRRAQQGDIDPELAEEERAEAARALLRASETMPSFAGEVKPAVFVTALAVVIALSYGAYMVFGHPGMPDQPYVARLKAWTQTAESHPEDVPAPALAAVLRQRVARYGNQPAFWIATGQVDMQAGLFYDAAKAFEKARSLSPSTFKSWSELGEALTFVAKGTSGADAQAAFARALALDPNDARAHYYLGRLAASQGRYDEARSHFSTALSQLASDDGRRVAVVDQLKAADQAQLTQKQVQGRIAGMVATLEGQLQAQPENPEGWARLLRSYSVLNDQTGYQRALGNMRARYHDRPAIAADIEGKAKAAVGAENTGGG
ncbi:MAG: c-type cytochrome biogenesis protein CcmI [Asticcacaulis sp.]